MDYFGTLTAEQKSNIAYITKRMNEEGITNPYTQSAILSVVSKESGFVPKREASYSGTSNARIRQIFGSRLSKYTEDQLTALKKDDVAFFNAVYGLSQYGQTSSEGYKYRGGGLNQLTFKGNFAKAAARTGYDLVNHPELIETLPVATDVVISYFKDAFENAPKSVLASYNTDGINGFKNAQDSVSAVYHANAGFAKSKSAIDKDPTGGKAKAEDRVTGFLDMVKNFALSTVEEVKKKPLKAVVITSLTVVSIYILYKALR